MTEASLDALADAAGIDAFYWDIQGRKQMRSTETARRLLSALEIPAATDRDIAESLAAIAAQTWGEFVPPVVIARDGAPIIVPIRVASAASSRVLRWHLEREDGSQSRGECALDGLPIAGRTQLDGRDVDCRRFELAPLALGYHRLHIACEREASCALVVAPAACYLPPEWPRRRFWGIAAQLYAVRSQTNWGIGDFGDLRALIDWGAGYGVAAIGLNPLHALFPDSPESASPYAPSSRRFLNPLYLDVAQILKEAEQDAAPFDDAVAAARQADTVDYTRVAAVKLRVLEALHRRLCAQPADDESSQPFRAFVAEGGAALQEFATFQALGENLGTHDWARWPENYRNPSSSAVAAFAGAHAPRISFYAYLQWQCEMQRNSAAVQARERGMAIGLYNDLALGVDASSADRWARQDCFLGGLRLGAPPDPFNETGQEWGVVPFDPRRLREAAYRPFVDVLRANMRDAGALRIDHVMGLQRLFAIPVGEPPRMGAYLRFPLDDLLAIVALESHRHHCIVIGEDLGTVPEGFRERMRDANVLSCRVLYFEQENGRVRRPEAFAELACVSATTHDLATLRGYWTGEDIAAKEGCGIFSSAAEAEEARRERERDKSRLIDALAAEGLWPRSDGAAEPWTPDLASAIHVYLARAPSLLVVAQLDDLAGETKQVNLPGTSNEYPNWRRRLARSLEDMEGDPRLAASLAGIARARE